MNEKNKNTLEVKQNFYRTASNKTFLVPEIPYIINEENVIIKKGQEKTLVSILRVSTLLNLLRTEINQVHSQQEELNIILKEQLKGLLQLTMHFHL